MKNDTKTCCASIAVVASIFFSGCYTANMGDVEVEEGEHNQFSLKSVEQVVPKITYLSESKGCRHYTLELVAQGEFTKHKGVKMVTREGRLCVGLMPGIAVVKSKQNNELLAVMTFMPLVLFNGILCGTPTISSLFVEPFLDYRGSVYDPCFTDFGLIGCRKYLKGFKGQRRVERSVERINNLQLFGYSVSIDGERNCDGSWWTDSGAGTPLTNYTGKAYFTTTKSAGSKVAIKLLSAPVVREDSDDKLSDLVGVEMEAVLP